MRNELRTYAEVNLQAIRDNIQAVRGRIASDVKLMAVIKADGYGHGAVAVGHALETAADYFAVATADEAQELREAGIALPILVLGYTLKAQYPLLLKYDITQTVYTMEDAKALNAEAKKAGKTAKIHIALDTGMGRIGFIPDEESADLVKEIAALEYLELEGMFTHFATADETDKCYSRMQMDGYDNFVKLLEERDVEIPLKHICNSAGIIEFDDHRFQMVRSGIITYGLYPSEEVVKEKIALKPALSWKAHVVHVKTLGPGHGISYGKTFITSAEETKIATISLGYGDGYPRALSNKGRVLIHGQSAPIVGRVCMDQFMVDVTAIEDVQVEDEVTVVGRDGDEFISVEEVAQTAGTFNYEFVCDIGKRVHRVYVQQEEE